MLPNYLKKHIRILSTWLQCTDRSSVTISLNCNWLVSSICVKTNLSFVNKETVENQAQTKCSYIKILGEWLGNSTASFHVY